MRIYKFGGASVQNAESVRNLGKILLLEKEPLIIVVSAMGKTTNAIEKLTEAYFTKNTGRVFELIDLIKQQHIRIFNDLLRKNRDSKMLGLLDIFSQFESKLKKQPSLNYDYEYDQIVPFGELFSTYIVHAYLEELGMNIDWFDVREIIKTDNQYRSASVDWEISQRLYNEKMLNHDRYVITQGFIGGTVEGVSTTLGREGSDYTASILAYLSDAEEVVIWKDVPGIMNADPKQFDDCVKLDKISYHEAIELAFYGAKVIHPKTIQPIKEKRIPLKVKSFLNPEADGSIISDFDKWDDSVPVYILKDNQILISISPRDFSFIMEKHISQIFALFDKYRAQVNLSQNSAISFSACVTCDDRHLEKLIVVLKKQFKVLYNTGLQLITIRHYTEDCITKLLKDKDVLLEQRSRRTTRYVVREK
jgi:aspartate kinase